MPNEPVMVSMYNVGFGDCFLLRFPGPGRERKVLIDCGSIKQGAAGSTDVIVKQIIEDVTSNGTPRIDVVAVSHRHKDHVSGFGDEAWRDVEVGEVWMPWIEDPGDERARQILHEMANFARDLRRETKELQSIRGFSAAEQELLDHVLENSLTLTNEKAMATLHRGFQEGDHPIRRMFLARSDSVLETAELPGVRVHVLGPSTDEEVIREMNPPSSESFLRAAAGLPAGHDDLLPFSAPGIPYDQPSYELKQILRAMASQSALWGAVALESAVNNTSLMLVFEVGKAALLFPGDSQWGAWKLNLEDSQSKDLLKRTTFYKIGHHGSHNATPVSFVDHILNEPGGPGADVWAAASVTSHGRFKDIPRLEVLEKLGKRIGDTAHVIRSDKAPATASTPPEVSVLRKNRKVVRIDFELPV